MTQFKDLLKRWKRDYKKINPIEIKKGQYFIQVWNDGYTELALLKRKVNMTGMDNKKVICGLILKVFPEERAEWSCFKVGTTGHIFTDSPDIEWYLIPTKSEAFLEIL